MVDWLRSPGDTRSRVLGAMRILVGVTFVLSSNAKFLDHAKDVADFRHWGLTTATSAVVYVIGTVELLAGGVLASGRATRIAAIVLAGDMTGAILTAGLIDGGFHLIVPPLLGGSCLLLAMRGGGARRPWRAPD